ncbi:hypothetical protein HPU229334_12375 [Helicobacter pullorum]|uniref:Uncharacterized protein n=1 Tax=Helicobacter pullorum TaxID=35818 RepID=A0A0N0LSH9_9HELI|nr:hypothetical protein HPU229334_12375 [Helicobacter pullorum]
MHKISINVLWSIVKHCLHRLKWSNRSFGLMQAFWASEILIICKALVCWQFTKCLSKINII